MTVTSTRLHLSLREALLLCPGTYNDMVALLTAPAEEEESVGNPYHWD